MVAWGSLWILFPVKQPWLEKIVLTNNNLKSVEFVLRTYSKLRGTHSRKSGKSQEEQLGGKEALLQAAAPRRQRSFPCPGSALTSPWKGESVSMYHARSPSPDLCCRNSIPRRGAERWGALPPPAPASRAELYLGCGRPTILSPYHPPQLFHEGGIAHQKGQAANTR